MKKVLVIKRDKLGDMLISTVLFQALREELPYVELHVLASDYNAWVIRECSVVDKVFCFYRYGRGSRITRTFRNIKLWIKLVINRYDLAIVANGEYSSRACQKAKLIWPKRILAFGPHPVHSRRLIMAPCSVGGHESNRLLSLVFIHSTIWQASHGEQLVKAYSAKIAPKYEPSCHAIAWASRFRDRYNLSQYKYIVIGLGTRKQKRQLTAKQVNTWSKFFHAHYGVKTVLTWTPGAQQNRDYPGDDQYAAKVLAECDLGIVVPCAEPISETVGLIWGADWSIFPDSGLMHFAAASPGGVIGLFADPTNSPSPMQWHPLGTKAEWLVADHSVSEIALEQITLKIERLRHQCEFAS